VAYVPLLVALDSAVRAHAHKRELFALGYAYGLAFFAIDMHWIARLSNVAITVPWLKYPAWLAASAYLALFGGLAALLAGWLARRAPLAFAFPAAFLTIEELRASGELGFPWFQPGYSQAAFPRLLQVASLGGVTLVTLWLLALNVLVWRALAARGRSLATLGALLAFALPWAWGQRVLDAAPKDVGPTIALVQGNIPGEIKWAGDHQREILAKFLELSHDALAREPRPALVIWPETATGSYLRKQLDQAIDVATFVVRERVPVFTGMADYAVTPHGLRVYNAAGLFTPEGAAPPPYAKRHLVPFGERMPFEWLVPALGKLELGQAEWTPGDSAVRFPSAAGPFSCLICFESIFPSLARGDVRRGATWLVIVTNDEWFGRSAAIAQHADMAAFRAVENHVPIARCANTGRTEVIDAYGRVRARVPEFREATLIAPLPPRGPVTWYSRVGDWPGALAAAAVLVLALGGAAGALTPREPRG
jgi:apolipoprotein N-acyltransferase